MRRGEAGFGHWVHDHEVFDDGFVANDRFFQDYLPAYGTRYNANIVIPIRQEVATGFILELPAQRGPLNLDERELARRLGDHLKEALHAYERTRMLMAQALAGHGLLNSFPYPMWLVALDRGIVFENPAAAREIGANTRVVCRADRLGLLNDRNDKSPTERLVAMAGAAHGTSTVVKIVEANASGAWLHLSLMLPETVMGAFGQQPLVLATLFDPHAVGPLDTFALANLFDLTPTEAKVAARLADGMTANEIATAHGTAVSTVRTQVSHVISKMGVERSAEVVRILRQGQSLWAVPRAGA